MRFFSRPPFRARLFAPAFSRPPFRARLFALTSCLLLIGMLAFASACLADAAPWDANVRGQFITSLCQDNTGHLWIGTEDNGIWQYDPSSPSGNQYTHFTTKDGLGDDNAYALACDKAGRIWLGSLNHGVSVFNGKAWRTYGPLDGPLGSRVFALAVSPTDGSVWGATEAGLFRYQNGRWTYFTRADGLPSDQANALAFALDGTLYVATQCDGIAIASPDDNYKSWRIVPGPNSVLNASVGTGLPSALINCLLVSSDNVVYAGTDGGLAFSRDEGESWTFTRGNDWKAKLAGLLHPVTPAPIPAALVSTNFLLEDYVTCLAEDASGRVWIGHRQQGVEVFDPKTIRWVQSGANGIKADDYVNCLLMTGTNAWVGLYGGGLHPPIDAPAEPAPTSSASVAPLPVPAKPPTLAELNAMLRVVSAVAPDKSELEPKVVALDDDWVTEGDWLGRYGRYWACLSAMSNGPFNYIWGAGGQNVDYRTRIGPHHIPGDKLRYWVQWLYTQDPRVLEMPPTYLDSRVKKGLTTRDNNRREAEQDDHGEAYPQTQDGPSVYMTLTIPPGLFYLSLYDVNYNGHEGDQHSRDYRISIRTHSGSSLRDISGFGSQAELSHGRIQCFWGGVWKRFLVRGPQELTVEVNRNNSINTILPGVMLDLVDEMPLPYFPTLHEWKKLEDKKEFQRQTLLAVWRCYDTHPRYFFPAKTVDEAAVCLYEKLEQIRLINSAWYAMNGQKFYASLLRWYLQNLSSRTEQDRSAHIGECYYQTNQFSRWEKYQNQSGLTSARQMEKALRWDGISEGGQGYDVVTDYLAEKTRQKKSGNLQNTNDKLPYHLSGHSK